MMNAVTLPQPAPFAGVESRPAGAGGTIAGHRQRKGFLSLAGLAIMLAGCATGCTQIGVIASVFELYPKERVKAQYTIPPGNVTILVDDDLDLVQPALAREMLLDSLAREFADHDIAERVTRNEEIARLRQASADFERMPIRQVGRRLNADFVLWISIEDFHAPTDIDLAVSEGRFAVKLKLFDVHEEDRRRVRLWPANRDGHRESVTLNLQEVRACRSSAEIHRKLADSMAASIARLFYDYTVE